MNFAAGAVILSAIAAALIIIIIISVIIKNKNTAVIRQSRTDNLEELKNRGFQTQDIKHIFFKGKDEKVFYFDYKNRAFAVEEIDYKLKKSNITGVYPLSKITAAALIQDGNLICQNNIIQDISLNTLYKLDEYESAKTDKADSISLIDLRLALDKLGNKQININILNRTVKLNDERCAYYTQISKELYEIFENELLANWMKKEKIDAKEKPKLEKNYQDKLRDLKNYREEGIVSELMNYTKKIISEDN